MREYLQKRIDLAKALMIECEAASYADVVLVLTAILSACASYRWPGENIDKKRFVELLVRYSSLDSHAAWVSVPSLINDGLITENATLYGKPGQETRIFIDEDIDLSFEDARRKYPEKEHPKLTDTKLRKHCHAHLIYTWLRCGYAHEYLPHGNVTPFPPTRRKARISYIGRGSIKKSVGEKAERMVFFDLEYLLNLVEHHVSILPDNAERPPESWWIDGGT